MRSVGGCRGFGDTRDGDLGVASKLCVTCVPTVLSTIGAPVGEGRLPTR